MYDLLGEPTEAKNKTFDQEYAEYINSAAWKRKRDAKISQVGGKCEQCGKSKWAAKLEVHHLHYKNFKHERMEDLQVLCPACHGEADVIRKVEVKEAKSNKAIYKGFENWMDRGNNGNWRRLSDTRLSAQWGQFLSSISRNSGKDYSDIPFWRNPKW